MVTFPEQPMDGSNFTAFFTLVNNQTGNILPIFLLMVISIALFAILKTANTSAKSAAISSFITSLIALMLYASEMIGMFEFMFCIFITAMCMLWSYIESSGSAY